MAEWFVAKAAEMSDGDRRIVSAGRHEIGCSARTARFTPTAIIACMPAALPARG
jgi:hypothetical protein